jgi:hypothetical protein
LIIIIYGYQSRSLKDGLGWRKKNKKNIFLNANNKVVILIDDLGGIISMFLTSI